MNMHNGSAVFKFTAARHLELTFHFHCNLRVNFRVNRLSLPYIIPSFHIISTFFVHVVILATIFNDAGP